MLKGADSEITAFIYTPRHGGKDGEPVTLIAAGAGPCWFSSRMVRDEYVRQRRGNTTRFTSEDQPPKRQPKPAPKPPIGERQGDGPSSSSSSSSSKNTPKPPRGGGDGGPEFARFYDAYPRKVGRPSAVKAFVKLDPDAALVDQMIAAIARQGLAQRCQRGETRFVPHPATWINDERWVSDEAEQPLDSDRPAWALEAGFNTRFDAENVDCTERNYKAFRDGKRLHSGDSQAESGVRA
ncbi:MAG: hypothetical protein Q8R98_05105 [Rubrivivax sp.]|nr:hypothetical protein [Rubrivivax sp.]